MRQYNKNPGVAALGFLFIRFDCFSSRFIYYYDVFYKISIASPKEKNLYFSCTATS